MAHIKQPSLFITHGGGPCFWIDYDNEAISRSINQLKDHFSSYLGKLPEPPKAILMISAHWEEETTTISTAAAPPMLYDYYGFPEHTYHLSYPAPGGPALAAQIKAHLEKEGFDIETNDTRGFDHGVFVPMLIIDPDAHIPVIMLSLKKGLDLAYHIALGKMLEPLREQGILIVGSGSSYHNLRQIMNEGANESAKAFDSWLNTATTLPTANERNQQLMNWDSAPSARTCHPREDHLLPLMVASGAAGEEQGRAILNMRLIGKAVSCFAFGSFDAA